MVSSMLVHNGEKGGLGREAKALPLQGLIGPI